MAAARAARGPPAVRELGTVKLLARVVHGVAPKDLRGLVDDGKKQVGSGIVAIVGISEEGKAGLVVGVTADLTATHDAVDLVRVGAEVLGGKGGGGRPDLAQAGGPDADRAERRSRPSRPRSRARAALPGGGAPRPSAAAEAPSHGRRSQPGAAGGETSTTFSKWAAMRLPPRVSSTPSSSS